jgi:hypothetical protein
MKSTSGAKKLILNNFRELNSSGNLASSLYYSLMKLLLKLKINVIKLNIFQIFKQSSLKISEADQQQSLKSSRLGRFYLNRQYFSLET